MKRKEPRKKLKRFAIRIALTLGWILFAFVAYKITQTDYEYANFDPYEILGVPLVSPLGTILLYYITLLITTRIIQLRMFSSPFRALLPQTLRKLIGNYRSFTIQIRKREMKNFL